jgi:hypothetical protein
LLPLSRRTKNIARPKEFYRSFTKPSGIWAEWVISSKRASLTLPFFTRRKKAARPTSGIHLIFNAPFEKTVNWLTGTPMRPPAPGSKLIEGIEAIPLDEIAARSAPVLPNAETTWLYPPAGKTAACLIRKKLPSENHPNGKSFVYFNQYSGDVLRIESENLILENFNKDN